MPRPDASRRLAAHARAAALKALIAQSESLPAAAPRRPARPGPDLPLPKPTARRPPLPKRLGEHWQRAGSDTRALLDTARALTIANRAFAASVRPPLNEHAQLARLDPAGWVVLVDSPAWAARLRFGAQAVQRGLQQRLQCPVPALDIRVIVPPPPPRPQAHRRLSISASSAASLAAAARAHAGEALGAALARLAAHAGARATSVGDPGQAR